MPPSDPYLPPDDAARMLARALLQGARHAALAYSDPATASPGISRIAIGHGPDGLPLTLLSTLAAHRAALQANPACALLLGEPGPKGDPLTHPRLMLQAKAIPVARADLQHRLLRDIWLDQHPKAAVYIDFADFGFFRFEPQTALLNAGFARAYRLTANDLWPAPKERAAPDRDRPSSSD
jgi:heme iron utilization protein